MLFYPGAYVPLTMEGNIVVDGVLTSCYPSAHHDVAHLGMIPIRWFPEIIEWMFGADPEFQVYVKIASYIGGWIGLQY